MLLEVGVQTNYTVNQFFQSVIGYHVRKVLSAARYFDVHIGFRVARNFRVVGANRQVAAAVETYILLATFRAFLLEYRLKHSEILCKFLTWQPRCLQQYICIRDK